MGTRMSDARASRRIYNRVCERRSAAAPADTLAVVAQNFCEKKSADSCCCAAAAAAAPLLFGRWAASRSRCRLPAYQSRVLHSDTGYIQSRRSGRCWAAISRAEFADGCANFSQRQRGELKRRGIGMVEYTHKGWDTNVLIRMYTILVLQQYYYREAKRFFVVEFCQC